MRVWINGALVDEAEARVSFRDHGLVVGDGVFEAVKVLDGRPFALTRHLARMRRSALGLGLPAPDLDSVRDGALRVVEDAGDEAAGPGEIGRLRITVTGGPGPLGSPRDAHPALSVLIAYGKMPVAHGTNDVVVVPWTRNEHGADEAIFGNTAGHLCEGTGTNVFVVKDGELVTPPLAAGCLAGVTRALVLEWYGGAERDLPVEALAGADEAFLTSTTRDVRPIRAVDGRVLPVAPGPVTREAMDVFAKRSAADIDP